MLNLNTDISGNLINDPTNIFNIITEFQRPNHNR